MTDLHPDTSEEHHTLDADAVCGACGTVNPEGTLICKQCGNNLRDQRHQRMHAADAEIGVDTAQSRRRIIDIGLGVFGILVVAWAVINVLNGNIDRWASRVVNPEEAAVLEAIGFSTRQ